MKSNKNTPVLQCHGDCDPTVKYSVGCKAAEVLKSFNPDNHDFKTYKGLRHWVCPQVNVEENSLASYSIKVIYQL